MNLSRYIVPYLNLKKKPAPSSRWSIHAVFEQKSSICPSIWLKIYMSLDPCIRSVCQEGCNHTVPSRTSTVEAISAKKISWRHGLMEQ